MGEVGACGHNSLAGDTSAFIPGLDIHACSVLPLSPSLSLSPFFSHSLSLSLCKCVSVCVGVLVRSHPHLMNYADIPFWFQAKVYQDHCDTLLQRGLEGYNVTLMVFGAVS